MPLLPLSTLRKPRSSTESMAVREENMLAGHSTAELPRCQNLAQPGSLYLGGETGQEYRRHLGTRGYWQKANDGHNFLFVKASVVK